ncbi:MAG TPA: DNA/RNA nuclease SfsA [Thermoplasmata archaeon]|nr:DNA/RNA nuclease SfsA [Thermoplasmata archaeon]
MTVIPRHCVGYPSPGVPVRVLERPNRFLAIVARAHRKERLPVHVPNPGRMEELILPGITQGWIVRARPPGPHRTLFDLVAVRVGAGWVSVDSRIANRLVAEALRSRRLRRFGEGPWIPEYSLAGCRWDFALPGTAGRPTSLLEVKSSNLRVGRTALFPDAPTSRGTHHLEALTRWARTPARAGMLFVIQRDDVRRFAPNRRLDPAFGEAFDRARRAGVRLAAVTTRVRPEGLEWGEFVPVTELELSGK